MEHKLAPFGSRERRVYTEFQAGGRTYSFRAQSHEVYLSLRT